MSKKKSKTDPYAQREAAKYDRPIPSREFILEHLNARAKPASYMELALELDVLDEETQIALHRRIKAMIRDGQLERLSGGFFWPAGQRVLLEGNVVVEKGKKPKTWVVPSDGSSRVLLSAADARAVYPNNRVIISKLNIKGEKFQEGRLVEIIEQQRVVVTGRFVRETGFCHVIPHGSIVLQNILIPQGKESTAQDGDIVVVELILQPLRWTEPLGQVIEVLGTEDSAGIEIEAATRAYGLPDKWPSTVFKEASKFEEVVSPAMKRGRLDVRLLPFVTIDGEDAKDFDDAVYCEEKPSGGFRLFVAIADVSHYVRPNTALDKEAQERGNSVYFPGRVIPMLPEALSNGLCSLNPNVDRLCMICIMNINQAGKITRYEFCEGIMRSHARLTYTKVAALLKEEPKNLTGQDEVLSPHLVVLYKLYHILRNAREQRGAIEFETIETRILFDKEGKINRIEPIQRNDAHRLIEECMLCANVACARFLKKYKLPGLYRNHEGPTPDKLVDLKLFLNALGLSLGGEKEPKPLDYAKLLRTIRHRKDAPVIQTVLLRSLSQAVYSKENLGHFGLAYSAYCHFTSPIRRYPDLLVHRQIRTVLRGQWPLKKSDEAHIKVLEEALTKLGDHSSMTERRADDATRDVTRWLKCQYIQKHVGEEFDAVISGVMRFGFFAELKDIYIDGLVHATSLRDDDYYYFDAIHHRLMGERTGTIYKLGDIVRVKVIKVDIDARKIDFELVGMPGRKISKKKGTGSTKSKKRSKNKQKSKNRKRRRTE
jgi:ribonuclease R